MNLKSISIPVVSAGSFKMPLYTSIHCLFGAVLNFIKLEKTSLEKFRFINFDKGTVDV